MSLQDQSVVIIGGTSGIGLSVARLAQSQGARVTIASSRQSSVDTALSLLGTGAAGRTVDVLDIASLRDLFVDAGPVDQLVYTAGEPLSMMTVDNLDLTRARAFFDIRFLGALNAVHAVGPHLSSHAAITLTSGSAASRPGAGWALGASVSGAVTSLARALAVELAPVRVNAVAPGVLRSPTWSAMDAGEQADFYSAVADTLLVGRVGEVGDAAAAFLHCMTQTYTSGTVIGVDGGALLV